MWCNLHLDYEFDMDSLVSVKIYVFTIVLLRRLSQHGRNLGRMLEECCICEKQKSFGRNNRFSHFLKKRKLNFAVSSSIFVFILVVRKTTKAIFLNAFYKKRNLVDCTTEIILVYCILCYIIYYVYCNNVMYNNVMYQENY